MSRNSSNAPLLTVVSSVLLLEVLSATDAPGRQRSEVIEEKILWSSPLS